jgi:hypothetical protein
MRSFFFSLTWYALATLINANSDDYKGTEYIAKVSLFWELVVSTLTSKI